VLLGKCAIVRFFLAAFAAFSMFLRAARLCLAVAIDSVSVYPKRFRRGLREAFMSGLRIAFPSFNILFFWRA
jgi:hypothetical protein